MEDDLEYFITFPTPMPKEIQRRNASGKEDEDEDFVFVNGANGDKEPVVFLLGWLGAQDQHLAKYCTIYNQRGCITIRYTSPSSYVFFRPAVKLMPIARKLLSLLRDMSLDDHPVFFHMFSNNGSVLYYYLTQAMAEPTAPHITVKGCIFDSTPAPRRIFSGVRAMYEVTPGSVWMKLCVSLGMMLYLLGWKVLSISWTIISGKLPINPPWTLVEDSSRSPQLFLYSRADKLISFQDVELFMSERQRVGVPVVAKCWPDSPHVQHYRVYPEEYREVVYSFLTQCLSQEGVILSQPQLAAAATAAASPTFEGETKTKSD
ncbi:transmembrane protein 53-B-like isoform X3 [Portunus trituberculatus]|uniref:transmembrane protein 53-B-like isoform X3 n=1 Tax=Portunus trituberculatus TaxID=210409 RepID=UPI001E1CCE2D|nr:transmembrane protein 53-B-like isoform X3 [Portunus trituberculatus]